MWITRTLTIYLYIHSFKRGSAQSANGEIPLVRFIREGNDHFSKELDDTPELPKEYDFVVVGAGSAGSVLANRLTEVGDWKVLLVEAGDRENYLMDIPFFASWFQLTDANWKYTTVPSDNYCLGYKDRVCRWPRGKVIGGSSVLNFMIWLRGNKEDYDEWEALGNVGWGWQNVLPYFKKIENYKTKGSKAAKNLGKNGPLTIEKAPYATKLARSWVRAAQQTGLEIKNPNDEEQIGVSFIDFSLKNGTRLSANKAYLHPIRRRQNLYVMKRTRVMKIIIDERKRAIGIKCERNNRIYTMYAKKEILLSAGAINSPQLLMLSGIGPKDDLDKLNIKVKSDLKVGYNLMDHVGPSGLIFTVKNQKFNLNLEYVWNHPEIIASWMHNHTGAFGIPGGCEAVAFVDTNNKNNSEKRPNMEIVYLSGTFKSQSIYKDILGINDEIYNRVYGNLSDRNAFTLVPLVLRPKSRGRIKLKNKNPFSYPLIEPNYYSDKEDVKIQIEGIKEAIKITEQEEMRKQNTKLFDQPLTDCKKFSFGSDEYWECFVRQLSCTTFHPCGTCKMGPDNDANAVVDQRLRVYGIKGLRVIDASVMPLIPSGHTNAPTLMVAEKASDMIKEDWNISWT